MAAFADSNDLASYSGDSSLDGLRGTLLLEQASAVIRSYCRQTFDFVVDDEVELRGTWSRKLYLPERPVVSVSSVTIDRAATTSWRRVRDVLYSRSGSWGGPAVAVTVTYTHGFAPGAAALETVKAVCLQVATRASRNPSALSQESLGDWSASWGSSSGGFSLTAAEQAILDRFRHEYATA